MNRNKISDSYCPKKIENMADRKENEMTQLAAAFLRCLDASGNSGIITPDNLLLNSGFYQSDLENLPGVSNTSSNPNGKRNSCYGWFNNTNSASNQNAPSGRAGLFIHLKNNVLIAVTAYIVTNLGHPQLWVKIGDKECVQF